MFVFALLPFSSMALSQPAPPPSAEVITLGNSTATLPGPWRFAPGDSPVVNGVPLWAQPGFNDANWAQM